MSEELNEPALVEEDPAEKARLRKQRWVMVAIIAGAVMLLAGIVVAIYFLASGPAEATAKVRDIFIIFMALESLLIGAALVVLMIQLANLINLLQNEVKPILKSTSETVNTLRGTTEFLSENLVEPVIKLNSYMAGLKKFFDLFNFFRK
jgi:membrane-associated HD superfamily phosphohydrolase